MNSSDYNDSDDSNVPIDFKVRDQELGDDVQRLVEQAVEEGWLSDEGLPDHIITELMRIDYNMIHALKEYLNRRKNIAELASRVTLSRHRVPERSYQQMTDLLQQLEHANLADVSRINHELRSLVYDLSPSFHGSSLGGGGIRE